MLKTLSFVLALSLSASAAAGLVCEATVSGGSEGRTNARMGKTYTSDTEVNYSGKVEGYFFYAAHYLSKNDLYLEMVNSQNMRLTTKMYYDVTEHGVHDLEWSGDGVDLEIRCRKALAGEEGEERP